MILHNLSKSCMCLQNNYLLNSVYCLCVYNNRDGTKQMLIDVIGSRKQVLEWYSPEDVVLVVDF